MWKKVDAETKAAWNAGSQVRRVEVDEERADLKTRLHGELDLAVERQKSVVDDGGPVIRMNRCRLSDAAKEGLQRDFECPKGCPGIS